MAGCFIGRTIFRPYLGIILKHSGLKTNTVTSLLAVSLFVSGILQPWIAKKLSPRKRMPGFIIGELLFGLGTLFLYWNFGSIFLGLVLIMRSVSVGVANLSQEVIEMSLLPKEIAAIYFGLMQSSFLLGDALGAVLAGWIVSSSSTQVLILISAFLILMNAIAFPLFAKGQTLVTQMKAAKQSLA